MIVGMRLQKIMGITVVLALLTAVAAGLSVLNAQNSGTSPTWTIISRFLIVLIFGSFGLAVARESHPAEQGRTREMQSAIASRARAKFWFVGITAAEKIVVSGS